MVFIELKKICWETWRKFNCLYNCAPSAYRILHGNSIPFLTLCVCLCIRNAFIRFPCLKSQFTCLISYNYAYIRSLVAQLVKSGGTPLDNHWPEYFLRLCMSAARDGSRPVHSTSVTAHDTINRARLQSTAADGNTL